MEPKYLESLIDEDTQRITADIPFVLEYLFDLYGKIPSEEVKEKEAELRSMSFHPADPMVLLYNAVEKLEKLESKQESLTLHSKFWILVLL